MQFILNENYLITTDNWFYAPDGESYRAVWGKVTAIQNSEETLGVKTNDRSTNWYVVIGNMIVAGCQIHYAIQAHSVSLKPPTKELETGEVIKGPLTRIYNANKE